MSSEKTANRILRAFLSLAAERGMSVITTREIAAAAAVNEVTVFRHFGDKATLAREAIRRFSPVAELDAYKPDVDASSPQAAMDDVLRCLAELQTRSPSAQNCCNSASATPPATPTLPTT